MQYKFKGIPTGRFIPNLQASEYLRKSFEYDGTFVYGSLIEDREGRRYIVSECQASSAMLILNGATTAIEVQSDTVQVV